MPKEQRRSVKQGAARNAEVAFKLFDTDNSGDIDRHEVKNALLILGMPSEESDVNKFMKDASNNSTITEAEFERYYVKNVPDQEDALWQIFDVNGDGDISFEDVFKVAEKLNKSNPDKFHFESDKIERMHQRVCKNFDATGAKVKISKDEFNEIKETNWNPTNCEEGSTELACYRFQLMLFTAQTSLSSAEKGQNGMFDLISAMMTRRVQDFVYANPVSGKLPFIIKLAFAMPTMSTVPVMQVLVTMFLISYYSNLGAQLTTMSFFMALGKCFDVLSDPSMSYLTDSWKMTPIFGNMGRRRPFILFGGPVFALVLICLFSPPDGYSPFALGNWFALFYIMYFLMATVITIPYDSLGPELSDDYLERNSIFSLCNVFDGVGSVLCIAMPMGIRLQLGGNTERSATLNAHALNPHSDALVVGNNSAAYASGEMCDVYCQVSNLKMGYIFTSFFFGLWFVATGYFLCFVVKERCQHQAKASEHDGEEEEEEGIPAVVNLLSVLDNKPFVSLLPAWCLDTFGQAIVQALMPFFVEGVIRPESRADLTGSILSDSTNVMSIAGALMCLGGAMSLPIWNYIAFKKGKRWTWLAWSFWSGMTNILLLFTGKGYVEVFLVMTFINGTPLGARFLADTILSDIIDYDEFLTGRRSEATFLMFKSFLPKMVSIPASVLPIAFLSVAGYRAGGGLRNEDQSSSAQAYLILLSGPMSSALCIASAMVKLRFPLKTEDQVNAIGLGVALHNTGKGAPDPLSAGGTPRLYELLKLTTKEKPLANIINHFPGLTIMRKMMGLNEDGDPVEPLVDFTTTLHQEAKRQLDHVKRQTCIGWVMTAMFGFFAFFCGLPAPGLDLLNDPNLAFLPSIVMIIFGLCLVYAVGAILRLGAAKRLNKEEILTDDNMTKELIAKLMANRKDLKDAGLRELGWTGENERLKRIKGNEPADNKA